MKVLLIRPKSVNIVSNINVINLEPLDLEYLYTIALQEGANCEIFDALFDMRNLKDVLVDSKPQIVAICGYITQEPIMLDYSKIIKEYNPSIKVIVGGVHAEVNYNRFFKNTIDFIVHSSSLEPFRKILILEKDYSESEINKIHGICYRKDNQWIVNKSLPIDPNELPIPDRTHFNNNKHQYRYLGFSPCAIVKTAFSCPYGCNFCFCRKINKGVYAARDIELVVEEIEGIECLNIHIVDDTFLIDRERVEKFIFLIKNKGIKKNFIFYSRADFIVNNEDIVKELASIGTKGIIVGLEAIEDSTLDSYSKASSKDMNENCVVILQKYNIDPLALFIVHIDATKKDFHNLYKWIKRMNLRYASVSIFTPIPGTALYEEYSEKLTTDKMENWDFLHLVLEPKIMSRKAFYIEYYKLFLKITLIGKRRGVYDFVDMKYIKNLAREFLVRAIKDL